MNFYSIDRNTRNEASFRSFRNIKGYSCRIDISSTNGNSVYTRGLMLRATTYIRLVYQFFTRVFLLFIGCSVIRYIGAIRLDRAYLRFPRNSRRCYSLNNLSIEEEEEEEEGEKRKTRAREHAWTPRNFATTRPR